MDAFVVNVQTESQCVHCGLCLDACPTYRLTGLEAESPRGRLYLMSAAEDAGGKLDADGANHLDSCLGCLACETACPSGVEYGRRIEAYRPLIGAVLPAPRRWLTRLAVGVARGRFWLGLGARVAGFLDRCGLARVRRRLPGLGLLPATRRVLPGPRPPGPGPTKARARAVLLPGCTVRALRPSIADATLDVLRRNSIEAVELENGLCCGALSLHAGDLEGAKLHARRTTRALAAQGGDYVTTCTAGCGALLRHYDRLLADADAEIASAASWVARHTRDVSEVLVECGFERPQRTSHHELTIAYHDACHLLHAASVSEAPREILRACCARVIDLGENALCCGSAGAHGLLHAKSSEQLSQRKAQLAAESDADVIAIANIGCILQLERALALNGIAATQVLHPIEHLAAAYRDENREPVDS